MKQASPKKLSRRPLAIQMNHRLREGIFILSVALAVFLFVSFATFHNTDPGWSNTGLGNNIINWGGRIGAFLADALLSIFGYIAYLLSPIIIFTAWLGVRQNSSSNQFKLNECIFQIIGFLLIIVSSCGLIVLSNSPHSSHLPVGPGGILGDVIARGFTHIVNSTGGALFLLTALLCGVTLFTGFSWLGLIDVVGWKTMQLLFKAKIYVHEKYLKSPKMVTMPLLEPKEPELKKNSIPVIPKSSESKESKITLPKIVEKVEKMLVKTKEVPKTDIGNITVTPGNVPPLNLLNPPSHQELKAFSNLSFEQLSQLVEQRLLDFGVEVKVVAVHPGPVITRFELDLAPGIKVSKITGLAKDIARSLSVTSVRVVDVIPGKSVIGLELPNEQREVVGLREIFESQHYTQSRSPVSLALGKDIAGFPVVVDLAKMPHLLVAGTTGSGKSVSLNAMLLSMLFKSTPEQLRLIMIDPKMLELSIYEGIPHLLTPVITDMKDAANALRWCVSEMDRRYRLMASLGVRNLAGCNAKIVEAIKQGKPLSVPEWFLSAGNNSSFDLQPLPMIVVIADELADMMMVVGKKVEDLVTRIAQKARAAGIHLILATQRPSVDVITGLIKANVPTRIAFQVSSRIDSRTILDQQGAEQLLGHGDMLYLPPGTGVPVRVHGAYVADEEVHRVVAAWQTYGKPTYLTEVTEEITEGVQGEEGGEMDPLYDEALRIVTESRRASISLVQRRLRIGYNRAARIMEDMEASGVVSVMDHNGSREVIAPPPV